MTTKINNIDYADVIHFSQHGEMNQYQGTAIDNAKWPGRGSALGLVYCSLKLNGEAGELAEHVGKSMRDEGLMDAVDWMQPDGGYAPGPNILEPDRRDKLIKEVGDCLWYLAAMCSELGITLQEAASANLEKLYGRQLRDSQRGEGDDR